MQADSVRSSKGRKSGAGGAVTEIILALILAWASGFGFGYYFNEKKQ